ncbi:hypothetical protein ABBQ38_010353 [Trebouxia sp. C0009 RCD-2024]
MLPQRADVLPLVGAAHAVSRQDKPQHVAPTLQQPQPATSGAASPQPATPEADQPKPAAQSAGFKKEELNGVTSQTSEPQPVSSELASTGVASSSGAAQPQLATSVEAQPQRAMAHVLDMLFPAELPAQSPSSSSLAAGSRPALAEHTGASAAGSAAACPSPAAVTQRRSAPLSGPAAVPTADLRAPALPDVASLGDCYSTAGLHGSPAVGRSLPAAPTAAEAPNSAASIACATGVAAPRPLAAAWHVSMPCVRATSANGDGTDAAAATRQGASAYTSSASQAAKTAQVPSYMTVAPADVLVSSGASSQSAEAAVAVQLAALSQLAQQIAEAVAEAAFQLVKGASKAEQRQREQQPRDSQPHCQQLHDKEQQQQQTQQLQEQLQQQQQQQEKQQQQQKLHEAQPQQTQQLLQQHQKQPQQRLLLQEQQPKQQQQQQQQQQTQGLQKQQEQQIMTAASSVELLVALSADKSGMALAACLAMTTPAPHPGFTFEPASFSMATDTPAAPCLAAPASSSAASAAAAAVAVAAAAALPPSIIQANAGGATRPESEQWPPGRAFPEVGLQAPPVRFGLAPPVRLGPPAPAAMPPPPAVWPQLPAWSPHQPLRYWGQPPPAQPMTQYMQRVIAPPAPPPGPPPPQPAAGPTPLAPPPLPSGSSRLPSRPQKRKAPAHQQRPAAKRQMPSGRRAPQRADSAGSVGSVHSNSCSEAKGEDGVDSSSPPKSPPLNLVPIRPCNPPLLGTGSKLGPGKHSRRRLQHKSKLAECAQEAYARASGKAIPAAPATAGGPQRSRGQPPKSKGKQGKGKGPSYKPSQTQKGRVGPSRDRFYAPLQKYPK